MPINITVSGNRSVAGGGIGNTGNLALSSSTVVSNTASQLGGGLNNYTAFDSGTSYLQNSIIAANSAPPGQGADCAWLLAISRWAITLIQTIAGCTIVGDLRGNIIGREARLGPLQDNGGPTLTPRAAGR